MIAIVDAAPLYATVDEDDGAHARCLDVLRRSDLDLVVPTLVVGEAAFMVGRRLGAAAESRFLRGLRVLEIEAPGPDDWPAIAGLVARYANFPIGAADASVMVLADRLGTDLIVTLDRRHFAAVPSIAGRPFEILPH